ncbi:Uma2 family endonuclease [Nocardia arizonensis]|uniref:Uma2 family endonuclease n=1 Tax=Nocardia arizonensis TaxID=1141647 RepID=UPI0006CF9239|nr:Uma2 family endonuclease [Nocardia arizonensis]
MASPRIKRPDLPEYMTWEQLEQLPEEIARQIELWDGRVVWVRRDPAEHQAFTFAVTSALKRCARNGMAENPERCWRVDFETNIFFGKTTKSDFVTPDFLVYRCLDAPYQDIRASDVLLAGEVLSPSNSQTDMEEKKSKYAKAGIPYYWEIALEREKSAIAMVHAFALETSHGPLPEGVHPLYPANYLLTGKWTPKDSDAIRADFPFPIHIPWMELEF